MTLRELALIVCIAVLLIFSGVAIFNAYMEKITCEADGGQYVRGKLSENVCIQRKTDNN